MSVTERPFVAPGSLTRLELDRSVTPWYIVLAVRMCPDDAHPNVVRLRSASSSPQAGWVGIEQMRRRVIHPAGAAS